MANLQDLVGYLIKKITVMSNHDHNALKPVEVILQPGHHLIVQMVGRLVQDQHIGRIHKGAGKGNLFLLAAGKLLHQGVMLSDAKLVQNIPCLTLGTPVLLPFTVRHIILHNGSLWKIRHLGQIGDPKPVLRNYLSLIGLFFPCNDLKQSTFSCSIDSDNTNLITIMDSIRNIIKYFFISENFAYMFYIQYVHLI